jgi:hypothetical protein
MSLFDASVARYAPLPNLRRWQRRWRWQGRWRRRRRRRWRWRWQPWIRRTRAQLPKMLAGPSDVDALQLDALDDVGRDAVVPAVAVRAQRCAVAAPGGDLRATLQLHAARHAHEPLVELEAFEALHRDSIDVGERCHALIAQPGDVLHLGKVLLLQPRRVQPLDLPHT